MNEAAKEVVNRIIAMAYKRQSRQNGYSLTPRKKRFIRRADTTSSDGS